MRIFLLQGSTYVPSLGGANKANRLLLEQLAARGHDCHVLGTAGGERSRSVESCLAELAAAGVEKAAPLPDDSGVVGYRHAGVKVEAVLDGARLRAHAAARLRLRGAEDFDRVLVSSEDPGQVLLREAVTAAIAPVVYIAHTTLHLPFGPDGFLASPTQTDLLRRTAGILAVSGYIREYLRRWGGLDGTVLRFPVYGQAPFPTYDNFDRGAVTLINPCAVKGIAILLGLARRCPDLAFAAVPTWGTTADDRAALAAFPNLEILAPVADVDRIFARCRVLLVPSLWGEAFGQVAVEAMLRGVPVLASDAGGLPEATLGVGRVLPVRPILRYEERFDERNIPVPVVPEQDVAPWEAALREILVDRVAYGTLSGESRRAALGFVSGLGVEPFESWLAALGSTVQPVANAAPAERAGAAGGAKRRLDGLSPEKLELLARRLQKKQKEPAALPQGIPRLPRQGTAAADRFPLSFAQQRLWFLDRLEPGSPFYSEHFPVHVAGTLAVGYLAAALDEIVRRHEVLRTTYTEADGEPVQVVHPKHPSECLLLPVVDLDALPMEAGSAEAERLANADSRRPFDLARGPVLRVTLLRLAVAEHLLLITAHHIAVDNWSASVVFAELTKLYRALTEGVASALAPILPELAIQYSDFAIWQRGWLERGPLVEQLDFWKCQLAGVPTLLDLPSDRPRPARQSFRGGRALDRLSPSRTEALKALARSGGATPYMLFLGAFQALLHRYTGDDDLVVGTPVAGRTRREVEPLVGFFLNSLPMRSRFAPHLTSLDLLDQARRTALDAFAHQDLPFDRLIDALAPDRSLSHAPLFQVLFNFLNLPGRMEELPGARLAVVPIGMGMTRYDLELYMDEWDRSLSLKLLYSADLFDGSTIERLLRHFALLLAGMVERPHEAVSALTLLSAAEEHQLRVEGNDTAARPSGATVVELFFLQASRSPDAPALVQGARRLTYRQLAAAADRLAARLERLGVGREDLVGVSLPRSPETVVAVLGILATGGGYVPLDPSYPRERLAAVLEDSRPRVLLTQATLATEFFAGLPGVPPLVVRLDMEEERDDLLAAVPAPRKPRISPDQLAYVLFTSGSTGRPKGVEVPHRGLSNFLAAMAEAPGFPTGARLLAVTSLAFDITGLDLFLPLLAGGCVELATGEEAADGAWLAHRLAAGSGAERVHMLQATPATWRLLLDAAWPGTPGLVALCGGEALPPSLARSLTERTAELWNVYGPTETTVWCSASRIEPTGVGPISIGGPIANVRFHLLDRELWRVPTGILGELYIGGAGLARGYRGRADLTAERFLPDPWAGDGAEPGSRLYRTGDLGRHLAGGGGVEVLGRIDHQVKVRGFRIELGEIEAALVRHPGIREGIVGVRQGERGEPYLVAWFVAVEREPDRAELRSWLARSLPEYMLPAFFVGLPELPLTANRKVDRKALPDPMPVEGGKRPARVVSPVEELLLGIWAEVLGIEDPQVDDDFFTLGGHSLLAAKAISRICRHFAIELPIRALFEASTPAALARLVEPVLFAAGSAEGAGKAKREPIERVPRSAPLPLSFPQRRLWYLDQLHPGSAAYNLAAAVHLEGPFAPAAFAAALTEVVRRHEALRTHFPSEAESPVQVVTATGTFELPLADLSRLPAPAGEAECLRLAWLETQLPFDLARGPVFRAMLLKLGSQEHAVALTLHHIVGDAWSLGVLVDELAILYAAFAAGQPSPLPELPIQYADFAVWQHRWMASEACAQDLSYWRAQLAGASFEVPTDLPRRSGRAILPARQPVTLSNELGKALSALSRSAGGTLFHTLLAAFSVVLGLHARSEDVVVGSNVANRNRLESEGLVGFFVNLLVLRIHLAGAPTFLELLSRVRGMALEAYVHQDLPFDRLVQELGAGRDPDRTPLFQVKLDLLPRIVLDDRFAGLRLRRLDAGKVTARYDLHLEMAETAEGLSGALLYDAGLFEASTAARLVGFFERLLEIVAGEPELRLDELRRRLIAAERELRGERRQARLAPRQTSQRRPVVPATAPNPREEERFS